MSSIEENGGVRYSVKELVQELTRTISDDRRETVITLARIEAKLDAKADHADLKAIEHRVANLELTNASTPHLAEAFKALDEKNTELTREIVVLKTALSGDDKLSRFKRWLLVFAVTTIVSLAVLAVQIYNARHH